MRRALHFVGVKAALSGGAKRLAALWASSSKRGVAGLLAAALVTLSAPAAAGTAPGEETFLKRQLAAKEAASETSLTGDTTLRNDSTDTTLTLGNIGRASSLAATASTNLTFTGAGNIRVTGAIDTDASATLKGRLTKTGAGRLTLTGANTFSGQTRISRGELRIENRDALPGAVHIADAANTQLTVAARGAIGSLSGGAAANATGDARNNGKIVIFLGETLTINQTADGRYRGRIAQQYPDPEPAIYREYPQLRPRDAFLEKAGPATLTLSGAGSYTGWTRVSQGALALGASGVIADSSALIADGGRFDLGIHNETLKEVTLNSGEINRSGATGPTQGVLTVNSAPREDGSLPSGFNLISGAVNAVLDGRTGLSKSNRIVNDFSRRRPRAIPIESTVTLSAANTYTGEITINSGALRITHAGALGTPADGAATDTQVKGERLMPRICSFATGLCSLPVQQAGGTLELALPDGRNTIAHENLILDGRGAFDSQGAFIGALRNTSGNNTWSAKVTLAGAATIHNDNDSGDSTAAPSLTMSGDLTLTHDAERADLTVTGAGRTLLSGRGRGLGGLIKRGGGTLVLNRSAAATANDYTGGTEIKEGELALEGGHASPDDGAQNRGVTLSRGATLRVTASETIGSLRDDPADATPGGRVVMADNETLTVNNGQDNATLFSGVISGAGGFTKAGPGRFTLGGNNRYTGLTTVRAGTLAIAHNRALGTADRGTVVNTGATLELAGGTNELNIPGPLTLNGQGADGRGALRNASGANTLRGPITLASNSRIDGAGELTLAGTVDGAHDLTLAGARIARFNGAVGGTTPLGNLTVNGARQLILTGALTLTGRATFGNTTALVGGPVHATDVELRRTRATFRADIDADVTLSDQSELLVDRAELAISGALAVRNSPAAGARVALGRNTLSAAAVTFNGAGPHRLSLTLGGASHGQLVARGAITLSSAVHIEVGIEHRDAIWNGRSFTIMRANAPFPAAALNKITVQSPGDPGLNFSVSRGGPNNTHLLLSATRPRAGATPGAPAVAERGDLALAPYYTVAGDWVTGLHIVNTSAHTQVVKMRFRRATDAMDVLDFNVVMPPRDVYAGLLSDDASGRIFWSSPDTSCTAPTAPGNRLEMPEIYRADAQTGYVEIIAMGRVETEDQPMARAAKHAVSGAAASASFMPLDCAAVRSNFFADGSGAVVGQVPVTVRPGVENEATTWQAASSAAGIQAGGLNAYEASGNALKVSYFIRDNATGIELGDNAVHIRDFLANPALSNQQYGVVSGDLNGFDFPDLNGGAPLGSAQGAIERGRFNALRASGALGAGAILNEWSANAANGVELDWVLTLPGQYVMFNLPRYFTSLEGAGRPWAPTVDSASNAPRINPQCPRPSAPAAARARDAAGRPAGDCDYRDLPLELAFRTYNREALSSAGGAEPRLLVSPAPPGTSAQTYLPKVVNLISFVSPAAPERNSLFGPKGEAIVNADVAQPYGWVSASLSSRDANLRVCDWDLAADNGRGAPAGAGFPSAAAGQALKPVCSAVTAGSHAPVIGFAAWSRKVAANPEASYGRIVEHSYRAQ